jgi:hypothetical protein
LFVRSAELQTTLDNRPSDQLFWNSSPAPIRTSTSCESLTRTVTRSVWSLVLCHFLKNKTGNWRSPCSDRPSLSPAP